MQERRRSVEGRRRSVWDLMREHHQEHLANLQLMPPNKVLRTRY
jgi:hypothetical protein